MLEEYLLYAKGKEEFDTQVKSLYVNMEKNRRTLHKTNGCYYAKMAYKFIAFDTLEEVEKFEQKHKDKTPFHRCGNCFKTK